MEGWTCELHVDRSEDPKVQAGARAGGIQNRAGEAFLEL